MNYHYFNGRFCCLFSDYSNSKVKSRFLYLSLYANIFHPTFCVDLPGLRLILRKYGKQIIKLTSKWLNYKEFYVLRPTTGDQLIVCLFQATHSKLFRSFCNLLINILLRKKSGFIKSVFVEFREYTRIE